MQDITFLKIITTGLFIATQLVSIIFISAESQKSVDKDRNDIYGYHCRMKGVSEAGLKYECDKSFGGDYIALYGHLAKGHTINFILNPLKSTVSFEYQKSGGISTRPQKSFHRDVKF